MVRSVATGQTPVHLSLGIIVLTLWPTWGTHTSSWPLMDRERVGSHCLIYPTVTHSRVMDRLHTSPGKQLGNTVATVD